MLALFRGVGSLAPSVKFWSVVSRAHAMHVRRERTPQQRIIYNASIDSVTIDRSTAAPAVVEVA